VLHGKNIYPIFVSSTTRKRTLKKNNHGNAMKLAIETYASLTGYSFEHITSECMNGNEVITESITLLMFASYNA
jgi:hypothetical protein